MSQRLRKLTIGLAILALSAGLGSARAEEPNAAQILNALKPKPVTRSLSGVTAPSKTLSADDQRFLDSLRTKRTRNLSAAERQRVASITSDKPSIDLTINFDYNSADINRRALPVITELGKALSNPELKGYVFLVAGHTDGKGGDEYNQSLSERRAESIKQYLISKHGIRAENLVSVGYGKSQLKTPENPFADENRRVQVVNMEASKEARN